MAFSCFARQRFADLSMIDRRATRLVATGSSQVAADQKKSNESKTKKPTDEGWLFACCLTRVAWLLTARRTKPISLNYCCITSLLLHYFRDPSLVFWGTSKAVKPEKVFGG